MGTKFTTKFWYMQSEDRVKKHILQFKEDQGDRYESCWIRYDWQISIYLSTAFEYLFLLYFQSVFGLLNSIGRLS